MDGKMNNQQAQSHNNALKKNRTSLSIAAATTRVTERDTTMRRIFSHTHTYTHMQTPSRFILLQKSFPLLKTFKSFIHHHHHQVKICQDKKASCQYPSLSFLISLPFSSCSRARMCGEQDYTPTFNPGEQSFGSSTQPAGNGGTGMSHQNEGRNGNNNNRSDRGGGEAAPSSQSSASLAEATAWMFEWYQQRWAAASSGVQQETEQRQVRRRRRTRRQQQPQQQQAQLPQPEQQQRQVVGVAPSTSLAEPTSVNVNQEQQVEGQQLVQVGNIGAALPTANPLDVEEQQRNFLAQLNNDALLAWGFDIVNTQTGQPLQHEGMCLLNNWNLSSIDVPNPHSLATGQELFVFPSNESQLTAWNESVTINTSVEPLGGQSQQNADVGASATHQYQPQQEQVRLFGTLGESSVNDNVGTHTARSTAGRTIFVLGCGLVQHKRNSRGQSSHSYRSSTTTAAGIFDENLGTAYCLRW